MLTGLCASLTHSLSAGVDNDGVGESDGQSGGSFAEHSGQDGHREGRHRLLRRGTVCSSSATTAVFHGETLRGQLVFVFGICVGQRGAVRRL